MSQKLHNTFKRAISKNKKLLSVFVTAGFPTIRDTKEIILSLDRAKVDFIELGVPFSDPIADGPIIQAASNIALRNGITLECIFDILAEIRNFTQIPIILMGYLNPFLKFGINRALNLSKQAGVDAWIIPDWPFEESSTYIQQLFEADIDLIQLIAPNTPWDRIHIIDSISSAFIYCVAYTGVTGKDNKPSPDTISFLKKLQAEIKSPVMIGFGIKNHHDYLTYTQYSQGIIVGSAFIKMLTSISQEKISNEVEYFVNHILFKEKKHEFPP